VINRATHTLALQISQGAQLVYALDSSGSPFIDLSGTSVLTIGGQGAIINNSTAANTPLSDGNTILHYEGISFSDANLFNSGINLSTFGSYVDNAVMVTTGTISENSFVTTQGTFISNITILNLGLSENALLNNAKGASVSGLTLKTNGTPALIYALNSGRIENVTSADGSNLAVTNSISGITVNDANPFQAQINPNLSNLNAYATVNDAYLAGLTTALISANTAETTNLVLGAGDQLALTLGQNIDWDLSSFSVDGSAGIVSLLLTFSDPTSVLSYGKTSSGVPFSGFGVNTDLIIEGKGGLIRNTSSVGNAFITSEGTLHISDTYFLLPNQFNGGIVGNLTDTVVDKVYFEGAGAGTNVAFDAAGVFSNIKITNGAGWAEGANFNLATNVGLIQNYSVDVATPGTVNFNGRLSNFYCSSVSQVSLSAASDSILDGAKVAAGGLLGFSFDANISRVNIISAEITSSNAYANDNSNLDITYSGGVISADELIYGTICYVGTIFIGAAVNLNVGCVGCRFIGCTFDDCEITVPTGATDTSFCGNITRNGTTFSNSDPSTIRAGNDAVIGNT
jgi:hypothetical protein